MVYEQFDVAFVRSSFVIEKDYFQQILKIAQNSFSSTMFLIFLMRKIMNEGELFSTDIKNSTIFFFINNVSDFFNA